jgi:hypothetical protein
LSPGTTQTVQRAKYKQAVLQVDDDDDEVLQDKNGINPFCIVLAIFALSIILALGFALTRTPKPKITHDQSVFSIPELRKEPLSGESTAKM